MYKWADKGTHAFGFVINRLIYCLLMDHIQLAVMALSKAPAVYTWYLLTYPPIMAVTSGVTRLPQAMHHDHVCGSWPLTNTANLYKPCSWGTSASVQGDVVCAFSLSCGNEPKKANFSCNQQLQWWITVVSYYTNKWMLRCKIWQILKMLPLLW